MKISEILKNYLEEKYNLPDLSLKGRKRNLVYYRMIISKIAFVSGETLESIGKTLNKKHDNILYYKNNYHKIYFHHKTVFNELVDIYGISCDKFKLDFNLKENDLTNLEEANILLKELDNEDLRFFIDTRLIPFCKMRKKAC